MGIYLTKSSVNSTGNAGSNVLYYYSLGYDDKYDEFFAYVDSGTKNSATIFTIDNTDDMCEYLSNGTMTHIDDTEGLEEFLKQEGRLQPDDSLLLCEELMW